MRTLLLAAVVGIPSVITAFGVSSAGQPAAMSGTWAYVAKEAPPALPAAPSGILGARLGISLDGKTVTLTRLSAGSSFAVTYPLDGSRVSYPVPGQLCEGERTFHETAAWENNALVITSVGLTPAGGGATTSSNSRRILKLEGDRLVIEATIVQQGQQRQVGAVYTRTTEAMPPARAALPLAGTPATIANAAWIGGRWEGTTNGVTTEERWTPAASGGMIGVGRALRGSALASFEFLCIAERGNSVAYLAMPGARTPATVFMATEVTPTSITFENPSHDYPKLIRYAQTPDGGLETTISGANGAQTMKVMLKRAGQ
jgi:hypothetical protein